MKKAAWTVVALALAASACGGPGDDADAAPATTAAPADTSTTAAPAVTTEAESLVPSGDPDIDAVVNAFTVAFDSTSPYEAKIPFVDDLSGLEETVAKYMETGTSMGGVGIRITEVVIDGSGASVRYDLLFNNNPTYPDLSGTAILTDAGWQVPRSEFCIMMSNARAACPTE
jgi:hypothetical protein